MNIMLTFIITNLTNGTEPWNTIVPQNPMNFTNLLLQNMPYFFPLVTMFSFVMSFYILTRKSAIDTRTMLLSTALAYTMLTYVEVLGSLTNIGWFFTFEIITLLLLYVITLFVNAGEK